MTKGRWLLIVLIAGLVAGYFVFDLGHYFSLGYLKSQQAAIEQLPAHYREAVYLRDVEQWPYEQISEHLDVPMNTVKSRINRGRALVASALTEVS